MWQLEICGPDQQAREVSIPPGELTVGRRADNDLVLADSAVSRMHARIQYQADQDLLLIEDLDSANGTLVNKRRLVPHQPCPLTAGDLVQIGLHVMTADHCDDRGPVHLVEGMKRSLSTDILSPDRLDPRTDLMYRVAHHLNTDSDPRNALLQISEMLREALGAAHCRVILKEKPGDLMSDGIPREMVGQVAHRRCGVIAPVAADQARSSATQNQVSSVSNALCVPVARAGEPEALIYLERVDPAAGSFDQVDLKLVETVSHMVALTLERLSLADRISEEQKLRNLLQSYLSPARVEDLLQNYLRTGRLPGLAERQATVLFADIADSTKMAERLGARLFGESLQRYYEDMTQIVSEHDGVLEKYLGDGVMAVFGLDDQNSNPERCAVLAGLAMLDFVESRYGSQGQKIRIGVGINSGPVVAGYVRTRDRVDFTILGDTVNVAHGLQSLARPNRLLIGPATSEHTGSDLLIRDLGTMLLKGREEPLRVHEVLRETRDVRSEHACQTSMRILARLAADQS